MTWTKVCDKSEIPEGSIKKVWARIGGGIPIAVAHHKKGFVAIPPVCPHLEEPLEESGLVMGCKLTYKAFVVMGSGDFGVAGRSGVAS